MGEDVQKGSPTTETGRPMQATIYPHQAFNKGSKKPARQMAHINTDAMYNQLLRSLVDVMGLHVIGKYSFNIFSYLCWSTKIFQEQIFFRIRYYTKPQDTVQAINMNHYL